MVPSGKELQPSEVKGLSSAPFALLQARIRRIIVKYNFIIKFQTVSFLRIIELMQIDVFSLLTSLDLSLIESIVHHQG
jgi:hypothetical protein